MLEVTADALIFHVAVKNTGEAAGKDAVLLFASAPQGKLGKPARVLCGFGKTKTLSPGESETLRIVCTKYQLASYDDSGATGNKSCYVLEEGVYRFYLGGDVRKAREIETYEIREQKVVERLQEVMAPVEDFRRMKPETAAEGVYSIGYEAVPKRSVSPMERRENDMPNEISYTGDQGYKLLDVAEGKVTMREFIGQFADEDLAAIVRGEGMCSYKVTPGTAGAFGGVTKALTSFGIPTACCADGPSGIRMDCGTIAFAMPNGTLLACTFNEELLEELYEYEGMELRKNHVDTLLGPGMNIHRNPLNGRNFEYFSEDPFVTGKIAAAQLRGMHKYGVTGTIKHFACNNQEYRRTEAESVVSERALREIYLRGYEIAVKETNPYLIMTSYGLINGFHAASNYDLLTTVLRGEWNYDGAVMTDWWAKGNDEGEDGFVANTAAMVRSQNDLYMVMPDAETNSVGDNSMEGMQTGRTTRAEYQRSAQNICKVLMRTPSFLFLQGKKTKLDEELESLAGSEAENRADMHTVKGENGVMTVDTALINTGKGQTSLFMVVPEEIGVYHLKVTCRVPSAPDTAQVSLSVFQERQLIRTVTLSGADKEWRVETFELNPIISASTFLKLYFGQSGMEISDCHFEKIMGREKLDEIMRKRVEDLG